nr:ABC transporter permease [Polycladospora coralii]
MIKKELIRLLKDKGTVFWLILLPIFFIFIFGLIFQDRDYSFEVHYTDLDQSVASKQFIQSVSGIKGIDLKAETEIEDSKERIETGKIRTYFVIPQGFESDLKDEKSIKIDFFYDGTQNAGQVVEPVRAVLNSVVATYQDKKIEGFVKAQFPQDEALAKQVLTAPIELQMNEIQVKKVNTITTIIPGYTVMFSFFSIIILAQVFLKEHESGMLSRLLSTPMKRTQYLIGMWIPFVGMVLVQIAVLFGFGYLVYDLKLGDIPAIIVLSIALSFAVNALGLLITFLSKNENIAIAATQVIALGGAALGGLWFPIDLMPETVQKIAVFVPQYWAQKGYVDIFSRGAQLGDIIPSVIVLLSLAVVCFVGALASYKYYLKDAKH